MSKEDLPGFNGKTALQGALRFIEPNDDWRERWGLSFGSLSPQLKLFAADAFGVVYGLDDKGKVSIFWPDGGDVEPLDVTEAEFYELIKADPDNTINLRLFLDASAALGEIGPSQSFAFKIELALGGAPSVDNIVIMDTDEYMRALGAIAQQIHDVPEGTRFKPE